MRNKLPRQRRPHRVIFVRHAFPTFVLKAGKFVGDSRDDGPLTGRRTSERQAVNVSLERELDPFFFVAWAEVISRNDAGARVPAKDRVVVTGRANRFRFLEPAHSFAK